jgi:hypothetical protein
MFRRNDFADGARAHDLAESDRRDVGFSFIHPSAHGRIERQIQDPRKDFAIARLRHWRFGELPIAALRQADRPRRQPDLMVDVARHDASALAAGFLWSTMTVILARKPRTLRTSP